MRTIPGTVPVTFSMSPAHFGWIDLRIEAGGGADEISCSHVYDPFESLTKLVSGASWDGRAGTAEIDEEGHSTCVRVDCEPGALTGRLRVFEPGEFGTPETVHIDAQVDLLQMALAWVGTLGPYAETYDPAHWTPTFPEEGADPPRTLARIHLEGIRYTLARYGLAAPDQDDGHDLNPGFAARCRERYAAAVLGA